jgi:hypothetical protein
MTAAVAATLAMGATSFADGTETLGPPGIPIADGTNAIAAGTGMELGTGTINIDVPPGATVQQVLLYWSGFSAQSGLQSEVQPKNTPFQFNRPTPRSMLHEDPTGQEALLSARQLQLVRDLTPEFLSPQMLPTPELLAAVDGDDVITVNGNSVTGVRIGGPTLFVDNLVGTAFRADITALGLVVPGSNVLNISGMDFTIKNDGAGVVVIYDDGTDPADIRVLDGYDLAFKWFTPPLDTTVPQTINFAPSLLPREATAILMVADVDVDRPTEVLVTVDGATTTINNLFGSFDGDEWDTAELAITIPAGVSAVTVQVLSEGNGAVALPASLSWVQFTLVVPDRPFADCDGNLVPDACDLSCAALNGDCQTTYPNECGLADDCNANNRPDTCDLAGDDCNGNGIPDSCEAGGGACDDNDSCTINDFCSNGTCKGEPVDCSALDDQCLLGVCNPSNGTCQVVAVNTGESCDDGVPCTVDDFCWNGACVGFEADCTSLNDACNQGVCNPNTGDCEPSPINEGDSCDDGDLCTADDTCRSGTCTGDSPDCSALDGDCVVGVCDPTTGACVAESANEDGACDDGDDCTVDDFCSNGACLAFPKDCTDVADACNVGVCIGTTGICAAQPANDTDPCDDGNDCTLDDICSNGTCAGTIKDCSAFDDACNLGVCVGTTGVCAAEPANASADCDDGDACTVDDICSNGTCTGLPVDCSNLDDACNLGVCVGTTGVCAASPINSGGDCDDGDLCTFDDVCSNGICRGMPVDCSALDSACQRGVCDPQTGGCIAEPLTDGATCDDGDGCTVEDACSSGFCLGIPKDCTDLDDQCNLGECVGTTGVCAAVPVADGLICDDDDLCTLDDFCSNGACRGDPLDCTQFDDVCNVGECVGTSGVCAAAPTNEGGTCDDNDPCTINDACTNGTCAGTPLDCSNLDDACNIGVCDGFGACIAEPRNEGGTCDDGDACTLDDFCSNGVCAGDAVDCTNLDDACNIGVCDSNGVCIAEPRNEGGACDDGEVCTIDDACTNGVCTGQIRDCSALDDACNVGVCDTNGLCVAEPRNEGGTCDDGNDCTENDRCTAGTCGGTPKDCTSLDDGCNVGVCIGTTGLCEAQPVNEGGACDDGDGCTTADACTSGLCVGAPLDCSALSDTCNVGVCVGTSGICQANPINEGGSCEDGDDCTVGDACSNGICTGDAKDCSALDDVCNVGVCLGTTGVCSAVPGNEGGACDDGDGCTVGDACSNGVCESSPQDCSGLDDACNVGVCVGTSGVCEASPINDGGTCDDGDLCTFNDTCTNGTCAGTPVDCSGLDDTCNVGVCEPTTGTCVAQPINEGGACDDSDGCTVGDACSNGLCLSAPLDCSSLDDACNLGVCIGTSGVCESVPANENGGCDDGDLCTVNDACSNGVCAGDATDCSALDDACNVGVCDPATGACIAQPRNEGGACDDGDGCTVGDFCSNGVCASAPLDCSALDDACNVGVCVGTTGVCEAVPANDGGSCDDGDGCTVNDACSNGVCAGEGKDCSALDDACNIGTCIGTSGVCEAVPANENGGCDDGDGCTVGDACSSGFCVGEAKDCSALDDACALGACIGTTGVCEALPVNEGGSCDDGDGCTIDDVCSNGLCAGEAKDCSALDDACNLGACIGTTGVCEALPVNEGGSCDDGDGCTVSDACSNGVCAGESLDCSALDDACNVGACIGTTGVCEALPTNEGGGCDDGDGCTVNDACSNGVCGGELKDCSAFDDACNLGACIGTSGVCEAVPANDGGGCDDGDACTVSDACSNGACAGEAVDCSALDDACNLGACIGTSGLCEAIPVNEAGTCDDGDPCTVNDTCTSGVCLGIPKDCSALDDACNVGACDSNGICIALPANEGGACDDRDGCTVDDACAGGACVGAPKDCSALDDVCYVGTCVGTTGICEAVFVNTSGTCIDPTARYDIAGHSLPGMGTECAVIEVDIIGSPPPERLGEVCEDACGDGTVCDANRGTCVTPSATRMATSIKGSLLIYPNIELRWDDNGTLIQDTFISLINDYPADVSVQFYYVNGDPPTAAVFDNGTLIERAHLGWNSFDTQMPLTSSQPTYWSAATGLPGGGGVAPFSILDPALPLGRPDPNRPGTRILRGYMLVWAVNGVGAEIRWNHLAGTATQVDYQRGTAWEYNSYAVPTVDSSIAHGAVTGTPGVLNLDGIEYAKAYDLLLLQFHASGAASFNGIAGTVNLDTDLTLLPVTADLRQETVGPPTTKASMTVWNANEFKLTGLDRCITCWDQQLLSQYGLPNHFLRQNLQTNRGKAQIDGLASQLCDHDFDEGDGLPLGADPRDRVSTAQPFVGTVAKELVFGN